MQTMMWRGHAIQAGRRTLSLLLAMVLVGSFTLASAAPAFAQDDESQVNETPIEEILNNADEYTDTLVSVTGRVGQILTPRAFVLASENAADDAQDDAILIAGSALNIPADLTPGEKVEVTGAVREFNPSSGDDLAAEDVDIDPRREVYQDFHNEPVIVARSITMTEGQATRGAGRDAEEIPLTEIFNDFDLFEGDRVRVSGEVEDIIGNSAVLFSVDDANEDLLVVAEARAMPDWMIEGAIWRATGTIRAWNDDAWTPEEYGIDPDDEAFNDYDDNPVLVAESVALLVPVMGERIDKILDDTDEWLNRTVTVHGKVAEVWEGTAGFTFEGTDGFLGLTDGEDLLVLGPEDAMLDAPPGGDAIVQVTGTVRIFDPVDFDEDEIGIDPDDEALDDYEGDPILVAESVNLLANTPGGTIEAIIDETDDYIGQTVTVAGSVNEVLSERSFTFEGTEGLLGIGSSNLLVIGTTETIPEDSLDDDVMVSVEGIVLRFTPDDLEANGIGAEPYDELFEEFEGEPVIIANSATPLVVD